VNQLPTTKRIVAVENPAFLRLDKTRLIVSKDGQATGIVPLEDLAVLILDYNEIAITLPLLAALAEAEVAVIICGTKHLPVATYIPYAAHHQHTRIVLGQASAGEPTKKRIWQQIVQAKIRNQGAVVHQVGPAKGRERRSDEWNNLAASVQSGDPKNVEAIAAAKYFPLVFGTTFLRDPLQEDLGNSMLNYGYALVGRYTCPLRGGITPRLWCIPSQSIRPLRFSR
jgi:CRISP-associated protein Cas1